jgi:predicted nucleic acid-binding protein
MRRQGGDRLRLDPFDTSVWIDHLRVGDDRLAALLVDGSILTHPFVIGEIALGHLRQRDAVLAALEGLARVEIATDAEVLRFIESHALFGRGVGYLDVHLLAATKLTPGARLWTKDKRLRSVAEELGLAAEPCA